MGIQIINTSGVATVKDAAGISKFGVKFRSMVVAWSVLNELCPTVTRIMMPVDQMGMSLRRVLRDSTSSTEQILHEFGAVPSDLNSVPGSLIMHALFSHLGT